MSDTELIAGLVEYLGIRVDHFAREAKATRSPPLKKSLDMQGRHLASYRDLVERLGAERTIKDALKVDMPPSEETTTAKPKAGGRCSCPPGYSCRCGW